MTPDPWLFDDPAAAGGDDPGQRRLETAAARLFQGDDGQRLLSHLLALTLRRSLGPDASESMLRHLEGQRALVAYLLGLVARGRARP